MFSKLRKHIYGLFRERISLSVIRGKCMFYTRYIDDIFLIWKGTEAELTEFLKMINSLHPTIKFDANYSFREINFLDTVVYKDKDCNLQTKVYYYYYYYLIIYKAPKSTNANVQRRILYIHYSPISLLEKVRLQFPFENFNRFG